MAGHAELEGTTRTLTPETRAAVREQIDALAKQTAALYGATAEVEWTDIAPALINPADFSADVQAQAHKLEGVKVITDRPVSLGGDIALNDGDVDVNRSARRWGRPWKPGALPWRCHPTAPLPRSPLPC